MTTIGDFRHSYGKSPKKQISLKKKQVHQKNYRKKQNHKKTKALRTSTDDIQNDSPADPREAPYPKVFLVFFQNHAVFRQF